MNWGCYFMEGLASLWRVLYGIILLPDWKFKLLVNVIARQKGNWPGKAKYNIHIFVTHLLWWQIFYFLFFFALFIYLFVCFIYLKGLNPLNITYACSLITMMALNSIDKQQILISSQYMNHLILIEHKTKGINMFWWCVYWIKMMETLCFVLLYENV